MLTMVHPNRASLRDGVYRVDRKFHVGMCEYAARIRAPILAINPDAQDAPEAMDMIDVPVSDLPYGVLLLKTDANCDLLQEETGRLRDQIARSVLVYGGELGAAGIARKLGVKYVLNIDYDLSTHIAVSTTQVSNRLRKAIRASRWLWTYARTNIPDLRGALSVHCNGYPCYDEARRFNDHCVLFLDTRLSPDLVISEDALEQRLAERAKRRLRLLYSGRYERMKGSDDAVKVGLLSLERGLDIEMHCYGKGDQRSEMQRLVDEAGAGDKIHIHDSVSYPELVKIAQSCDAFVCCHIQNDPSATYLESMGAGLPIVGYGNRMWRRLQEESAAGFCTPLHRPNLVANSVGSLAADGDVLAKMSRAARRFAFDHTFQKEYSVRVDDLNKHYEDLTRSRPAAEGLSPAGASSHSEA
jgi:glycosyltransferase involved in cell wall biosynthesis